MISKQLSCFYNANFKRIISRKYITLVNIKINRKVIITYENFDLLFIIIIIKH